MTKFLPFLFVVVSIFNLSAQTWSNDPYFTTGSGATLLDGAIHGSINFIEVNDDGSIMIFGSFTEYDSINRYGIARLHSNGTLDTNFVYPDTINAQITGQDGQGRILFSDGPLLYRMLPDGSIDPTFDASNLVIQGYMKDVCFQSDGKIVLGGDFTSASTSRLVRINEDGSVDNGFSPPLPISAYSVYEVALQSDGKVIVAGYFTSLAGSNYNNLIRLNTDGSIDNTFNYGATDFNNGIIAMFVQDDDRIVVGGSFTTYNGIPCKQIIRLNPNGDLDTTFDLVPYITAPSMVPLQYMQPAANGQFFVYGEMSNPGPGIFRINSDGSLDSTFSFYTGPNGLVMTCRVQADGNILVGGDFSTFSNLSKNGITRLSSVCGNILTNEYVSTSTAYYWPLTTLTYPYSGQYSSSLIGTNGCDSLIHLNLTVDSIYLNSYVYPTPDTVCEGKFYVEAIGNPAFQFTLNGQAPTIATADYAFFENLCPGLYDLQTIDALNDTLNSTILIPSLDNYFTDNSYSDSTVIDSLGTIINNCDLFQQTSIDSVFIHSLEINQNVLSVIWYIFTSDNNLNVITTNYQINSVMNGVYTIQLSAICQQKSMGDNAVMSFNVYINSNELIETTQNPANLKLYPNPAQNTIQLAFPEEKGQFQMWDPSGQLIYNSPIETGELLHIESISKGIYILQVTTEQNVYVERLVKD